MMFSSIFSVQAEDNLRKKCKEEEIPAGEYGKIVEKQQRSGTRERGGGLLFKAVAGKTWPVRKSIGNRW